MGSELDSGEGNSGHRLILLPFLGRQEAEQRGADGSDPLAALRAAGRDAEGTGARLCLRRHPAASAGSAPGRRTGSLMIEPQQPGRGSAAEGPGGDTKVVVPGPAGEL